MIKEGQVTFNSSTLFLFEIPYGYLSVVKEGDKVKSGEQLIVLDKKNETVFIESFGEIVVKKDDVVKPGDILCKRKGVLKNENMKAEINGTVSSINDNVIEIKMYSAETQLLDIQMQSQFDAKIEKVEAGKILLSFSAVQLNLLTSKGTSSLGNFSYIPLQELGKITKLKGKDIGLFGESIIVTSHSLVDLYPKLSALGVNGLISNSVDYDVYDKASVLEVPFGVISGFGDLLEDETLVKWFKSIEGQKVWFDANLNRLVVPTSKCPTWIKAKV